MKWEKHGDLLVLVDKYECKRAIIFHEDTHTAWNHGVGILGSGAVREYVDSNKRRLQRTLEKVYRDLL